MQRCYEIIGYPDWWNFSKKPQKKAVGKAMVTTSKEVEFNNEENSFPVPNIAHSGIVGKANALSAISKNNTWIIDTSAFDHMIRNSNQLQSVSSSLQSIISTANGTTCPIVGQGSVILSVLLH